MVRDLVPSLQNALHGLGALLDDETGNEEGRDDAMAREEIEHPAQADLPAVGALRQDDRPLRVGRIARSPHRLRVQVECQQYRKTVSVKEAWNYSGMAHPRSVSESTLRESVDSAPPLPRERKALARSAAYVSTSVTPLESGNPRAWLGRRMRDGMI